MTRKVSNEKKIKVTVFMIGLFVIGCHFTQQTLPADAGGNCVAGSAALTPVEFNSWFESGAVSLNGVVKPANSVLFPNVENCSFFKWTEQMFLWLTSPAPARYGGNGLVMNSPAFYDVSGPDENGKRQFLPHTPGLVRTFNLRTAQRGPLDLPVIREDKTQRLLEILPSVLSPTGKQLIVDKGGNEIEISQLELRGDKPVLLDHTGKEIESPRAMIHLRKDSAISPILKRLNRIEKFDKTTLVQKIMVRGKSFFLDLFGNFHEVEQGQADHSVLMAQNGSLVYYSLTVNNVYALFRTMKGTTVPSGTIFPINQEALNSISSFAVQHGKSPIIDSMALAIEIKCAWVEAKGLPDAENFIKMKAIVPTYTKTPTEWIPNGTKTIELAMVGMHVVGSAKGNQEMLWGTFEHISNNPPAAYTYLNTANGTTTIPQNTEGTWNFCSDGATGPFNDAHMYMEGDHIKALAGHTISPSDIRREMPWGVDGLTNSGINSEVIAINGIARSLLDPKDVRRNYFQTGTTWTLFGFAPSPTNQLGTTMLSNTTMETFTQPGNCFNCHVTNTTAVSHVFNDTEPLF